jgi:hypothetical protein
LSGQIFHERWNTIHAGTALDQPTIGKWYFWFTVFTVFWLSYMAGIKRFCLRYLSIRYWIFMAGLTVLCLFLVCLLTIPFWWLIQYIREMGWTDKRLFGLLYGIIGYLSVLGYYVWAVRFRRKQGNQEVCHGEMSAL